MLKVAMVSPLQPETHYTRYLASAIQKYLKDKVELLIYADRDPQNLKVPLENIKLCWTKSIFFPKSIFLPSFAAGFYPFQILAQARKDKPRIIHFQHEINMYGGPISAIVFPFALLLAKFTPAKVVVTVHAVVEKKQIDLEFLETFPFLPVKKIFIPVVKLIFWYLFKTIGWFADDIIVHSQYIKDLLTEDYGVKGKKIKVLPIGVPEKPKEINGQVLKEAWAKNLADKKVILCFGYILKRRGIEHLISAFEKIYPKHEDCVLVLAGGELANQIEYARSLREDVLKRGLAGKIIFTSFISEADINELFRICQFCVLPYTYSVSSSQTFSFAMLYEKPIVATNIGTLKEEVIDGENGLLCQPKDSEGLALVLERIIDDPKLYQKLVLGAKKKHETRLWSKMAEKTYEEVYVG